MDFAKILAIFWKPTHCTIIYRKWPIAKLVVLAEEIRACQLAHLYIRERERKRDPFTARQVPPVVLSLPRPTNPRSTMPETSSRVVRKLNSKRRPRFLSCTYIYLYIWEMEALRLSLISVGLCCSPADACQIEWRRLLCILGLSCVAWHFTCRRSFIVGRLVILIVAIVRGV